MARVERISRRGFFAVGVVGAATVGLGGFGAVTRQADLAFVRPPGAESNAQVVAACTRCGRCWQACPYGIVGPVSLADSIVGYGTPTLAFSKGRCDFCMKCTDACPTGALSRGGSRERDLGVAVVVKDACVAWDWAGCTVCKDECPVDGAIELDERDRPVIHADYCDGCGACERACPSASLRAYDAGVATKGIVVVSRYAQTAQIAQADQAGQGAGESGQSGHAGGGVSSEELFAGRTAPAVEPLAPHDKGVHPDGPNATREASRSVGGVHEA